MSKTNKQGWYGWQNIGVLCYELDQQTLVKDYIVGQTIITTGLLSELIKFQLYEDGIGYSSGGSFIGSFELRDGVLVMTGMIDRRLIATAKF